MNIINLSVALLFYIQFPNDIEVDFKYSVFLIPIDTLLATHLY